MKLNEIKDNFGATKTRVRVGRGVGSGLGKTCGKGQKGQKSRSGVALGGFEGGQMPLYRRLPKRGFTNIFAKDYAEINLQTIQAAVDSGKLDISKPITESILVDAGVVRRALDGVRLLGKGELRAKVDLSITGATKSALEAVSKLGGSIEVRSKK
jgi:large subunit ribosomal protein L15